MRHAIKNTSRLAFSDSCKNVNDRSVVRGSVLPRNAVTRSSAKLALIEQVPFSCNNECDLILNYKLLVCTGQSD